MPDIRCTCRHWTCPACSDGYIGSTSSPDKLIRAPNDNIRPDGITKISDSVYSLNEHIGTPEIEIVFVHGLQLTDYKHAYWKTWIATRKDDKRKEVCWPKVWLGIEFPKAWIWSLSYNFPDLPMLGETLVQEMVEFAQIGQQNCPIAFVCHGLGGLVVKEIVIKTHGKFGNESKYKNFLQNIRGFHFYATPHGESRLAELASHVSNLTRMVGQLKIINENNCQLSAEFERIARDHYANIWQFVFTGEARVTKYAGFNNMVVPEASARWAYGKFLSINTDHFGICKPESKMSTIYQSLTAFIQDVINPYNIDFLPQIDSTEKLEHDLMVRYNLVSRSELYDNREISIFKIGDREYLEGMILDKDFVEKSLMNAKSSVLEIQFKMKGLLKLVKIWHKQCEHLLEKYYEGVDKIVQALNVLIASKQGPIIGLDASLLVFICSKLISVMLDGEALLLLCSDKGNYNKAAFALSSPQLSSKKTFSRFALVLRELNWTIDFISYIEQLYIARDELIDNWKWCKKRHKLEYQGNSLLGIIEDKRLEDSLAVDHTLQSHDQKAFWTYLNSKPTNQLLFGTSSSSKYSTLWTSMLTCYTGEDNQDQLDTIWKKRLEATFQLPKDNNIGCNPSSSKSGGSPNTSQSGGNPSSSKSGSNPCISKSGCKGIKGNIPSCFWIDNLNFRNPIFLGRGASKFIYACNWLGETIAVCNGDEYLEAEVDLLARVQHPNVVELIGLAYDDPKEDGKEDLTLITELMEQDLGDLIRNQGRHPPFALPVAVDIVLQIVEAMIHLHQCGIMHRDLKPKNFLSSRKYQSERQHLIYGNDILLYYTIKIIDFGEAKKGDPNCYFHTHMKGTTVYRAPEVYKKEDSSDEIYYSWPADVYSFGMTCFEVFTGKAPFSDQEWRPDEVKMFVLGNKRPLFPLQIPSLLEDLIKRCWAQNPNDRPTFEEIRKDLWQCKVYYKYPNELQNSTCELDNPHEFDNANFLKRLGSHIRLKKWKVEK